MSLFDKKLRDRPFKSTMLGRRLRKAAQHKHRAHQFTVDEYDKFCAKTSDVHALQKICDISETGEWGDVVWDIDWWKWAMNNWSKIRSSIDALDPAPSLPSVAHDRAPKRRGRRSRLPSYQDDEAYQEDKETTLAELNNDQDETTTS